MNPSYVDVTREIEIKLSDALKKDYRRSGYQFDGNLYFDLFCNGGVLSHSVHLSIEISSAFFSEILTHRRRTSDG